MNVSWIKPDAVGWHNLETVDLAHPHFNNLEGVYIIWQRDVIIGNVVKVGGGIIRNRLQDHRNDHEIQSYNTGGLLVTWATVPANQRDGIERFLGDHYTPKVAIRFPDAMPIPVNLPLNDKPNTDLGDA